ncbi:MAG: c-type cytochrome [Verrucomicrobiaceae bacterium]|nr:c-type cytochrome [Verrucomicrobiaceae bacterium]
MKCISFSLISAVVLLSPAQELPLPSAAHGGRGVIKVDLNADGHEDLVVSNEVGFGVYLFVPTEAAKKNLEWLPGWTQVMREGKRGDVGELPSLVNQKVKVEGRSVVIGAESFSFDELMEVVTDKLLAPADSMKTFQLPVGYEVSLVAAEPQVTDPVFIDWDERGRMWVAEMGDYPFAEGESTKDGRVTWKDGVPSEGRGLQAGRIRILEDKDGDGLYESSTLFLDGLKHVTGLACWKGGVFVANIPDIFYAKDEDGDGKCDHKESWYTGFTAGNPQHLVNGFCWGLDGWFHGANGDSGGSITRVKDRQKIELGTNDFRFNPQTGEFKLETGRTQCGKWRDDFGNWFGNNNSNPGWHYWLPMGWLESHPEVVAKSVRSDLTPDRRVFPSGTPARRVNQASSQGSLTSGCNIMPSRIEPGVVYICEPANNLVQRQVLDYSGPTIRSQRHEADASRDFLTSTDRWFRPVMARTGPDGALYVVDMYRAVLEHPEWIPAEMAKRMKLRGGETMGRIWRVSKGEREPFKVSMASANGWSRDVAQRLIVEGAGQIDLKELEQLASSASRQIKTQALFTLKLLGKKSAADLVKVLEPMWPQVRGAAVIAAGGSTLFPEEMAMLSQKGSAGPVAKVPVIENLDPDRQKIVQRYLPASGLPGDAKRGTAVFQKAGCVACHRLGNIGVEVGPDLATVGAKPAAQLIEAIFDPNRAVEQRNAVTQITTHKGEMLMGLIGAESPGGVTLRMAGGADVAVKRADIKELKTLQTSLMPPGLEALMTLQDTADLLASMKAAAVGVGQAR